jgi:hypothetical protein
MKVVAVVLLPVCDDTLAWYMMPLPQAKFSLCFVGTLYCYFGSALKGGITFLF